MEKKLKYGHLINLFGEQSKKNKYFSGLLSSKG